MSSRIVVLSSKENFATYNVQEVVPYIEASWQNMNSPELEVIAVSIDVLSMAELTSKLIGADRLVITCFNYRMCKVMLYIREILKLNVGFIVYVHNLSSLALWPYRYFTSSDIFFKSDVFITSCENDKRVFEKVFVKPFVHVIPFFSTLTSTTQKIELNDPQNIIYIGPISPQKNLHNLILAYSFLKKKNPEGTPPLIFFGKEDFAGSPNMNLRNDFYQDFLTQLCKTLEIDQDVFFKGHVDQETIDVFLNDKSNLMVSPSLQSDENFGIEPLQAIFAMNKAVLSDWGAYSDLKFYFDDLVDLIPVTLSEFGPSLCADAIADAIVKNLSVGDSPLRPDVNKSYLKSRAIEEQKRVLERPNIQSVLEYTKFSNILFDSKMDYTSSPTQVFSSFTDPLFLEISKYYVGSEAPSLFPEQQWEFTAVPWMTYTEEAFLINDPQKGTLVIKNEAVEGDVYSISFSKKLAVNVSRDICERLFRSAYINRAR